MDFVVEKGSLGLIHYYYGNGCGKTSIALGHIVRALGHHLHPIILQFLKRHNPNPLSRPDNTSSFSNLGDFSGFFYGEYITLTELLQVPVFQFGDYSFIKSKEDIERIRPQAQLGWQKMAQVLSSPEYDLVVLDEIGDMVQLGLYQISEFIELLHNKRPQIEVIMTGHDSYPAMIAIADYITHLEEIRHPYQKGILAREGIEF